MILLTSTVDFSIFTTKVNKDVESIFNETIQRFPLTRKILDEQFNGVKIALLNESIHVGGCVGSTNHGTVVGLNVQLISKQVLEGASNGLFPAELTDMVCDVNIAGTLIHELTHYHQVKSGRLVNLGNLTEWEGNIYFPSTKGNEYFETPWEQEAFLAQAAWLSEVSHTNGCGQSVDDFMKILSAEIVNKKNIFNPA